MELDEDVAEASGWTTGIGCAFVSSLELEDEPGCLLLDPEEDEEELLDWEDEEELSEDEVLEELLDEEL